ncbi:MAG: GapR family DNA-binding domain-containing protein [Sneathiella sp.]
MPNTDSFSKKRLNSLIARVQNVDEEIKEKKADIKEIFTEAKDAGFNVKAMRECLKLLRLDPEDQKDHETNMAIYKDALGISGDQGDMLDELDARKDAKVETPKALAPVKKKINLVKKQPAMAAESANV